jgi:Xaa-Pro aminopeptidase
MQKQKNAVLKKTLSESGVDGVLITDINNVQYLSGFTGSSGFLIITNNISIFVTDFRYKEQAKMEVKGFKIIIESKNRVDSIKRIAEEYKIRELGFEDHSLNFQTYKRLKEKRIKLKALADTVESLRLIKSQEEITYIKRAVKRAENAFRRLRPFIKAGVTEQKLAFRLEGLLKEQGCKRIPFEVIITAGSMSALPHAKPTNRQIKKGDFILFDWGGEYEGYCSDMTRMLAIKGRHLTKQLEIYSIVYAAQRRAVEAVRDGVRAKQIDSAARDLIKQKGYGDYFGHGTGHGVGLAVHERPVISGQSEDTIKKGMVFTIEPGIYLPGIGGARIEDMIYVRGSGAEVLTTLPRKLEVIG